MLEEACALAIFEEAEARRKSWPCRKPLLARLFKVS